MATDIFQLLGTITVDTKAFDTAISNSLAKVNELAAAINGLNGTTANVNVNTNGGTSGGSSGGTNVNVSSGTNTNTSGNSGSDDDDDKTDGNKNKTSPSVTVGGGKGWTVWKGIASNLGTQAINWAQGEMKEFYASGIEYNNTMEIGTAKLATLLGVTKEEVKPLVDDISRFAMDTPLSLSETMKIAPWILNAGVKDEDLIDTLQMMGDLSFGNSDTMRSVAKAYTQILGKTKLNAQEANQLADAGVPIWQMLEDYYASDEYYQLQFTPGYEGTYHHGLTASDIQGRLNAEIEVGGIRVPAEDVTAAVRYATAPGGRYYNAMYNMMDTYAGVMERFGDSQDRLAGAFAAPVAEVRKEEVLPEKIRQNEALTALLNENSGTIKQLAQIWGTLEVAVGDLANWAAKTVVTAEARNPGALGEVGAWGGAYATFMGANPWLAVPAMAAGIGYDFWRTAQNAEASGRGFLQTIWEDEISTVVSDVTAPFRSAFVNTFGGIDGVTKALVEDWPELLKNGGLTDEAAKARDVVYGGNPFGAAMSGGPLWGDVVELLKHNPDEDEEEQDDYSEPVIYGDEYGAGGLVDAITFDPENYVPGNMGMQSLIVQLQNMPQQVTAAVQEGMNGVTITANVTTGDVRLQDGALVGALTPKINLVLGALNARSGRG